VGGDTRVGSFLLGVNVAEEEEGVLGEGGPDGGDWGGREGVTEGGRER